MSCLSASTFTVPMLNLPTAPPSQCHKCLSASTFTVLYILRYVKTIWSHKCLSASAFTVPQSEKVETFRETMSQMPIGKYIYCTHTYQSQVRSKLSQMPIGKYIYCTEQIEKLKELGILVTNAYRQVHLLYDCETVKRTGRKVTNAYRQVHLLYPQKCQSSVCSLGSQMPIGKYIYCTKMYSRSSGL